MTVEELRDRVIADGVAEVERVYAPDDPKREGALDGFGLCSHLSSREEFEKVLAGRERREHRMACERMAMPDVAARDAALASYWRHRYATLQIEWVLSCLKVAAWGRAGDMLSSRAALKVAGIVGTA